MDRRLEAMTCTVLVALAIGCGSGKSRAATPGTTAVQAAGDGATAGPAAADPPVADHRLPRTPYRPGESSLRELNAIPAASPGTAPGIATAADLAAAHP